MFIYGYGIDVQLSAELGKLILKGNKMRKKMQDMAEKYSTLN